MDFHQFNVVQVNKLNLQHCKTTLTSPQTRHTLPLLNKRHQSYNYMTKTQTDSDSVSESVLSFSY